MAQQKSSVQINLDGLDEIGKNLAKGFYVKIGVLGSTDARQPEPGNPSPMSNADIGLLMELGDSTGKIPSRSWLRMPINFKAKQIVDWLRKPAQKQLIIDGKTKVLFDQLGGVGEAIIDEAFVTGGFGQWQANAQSTIDQKGSSAPLINTSQLRRAVTHEVVQK